MVLAMDLALTMKLPALRHFPICSKQCRRLYHGDDTAVFLPNNFLSSFVAECVVYSYDELIRDRQSCFEEEKRRYIFSNIFLLKARPVLCDIVLIFSISLLLIHVNYLPQEMFHPLRAPRKYQQYPGGGTLRLKQTRYRRPTTPWTMCKYKKKHERTQQVNRLTDKLQLGK